LSKAITTIAYNIFLEDKKEREAKGDASRLNSNSMANGKSQKDPLIRNSSEHLPFAFCHLTFL